MNYAGRSGFVPCMPSGLLLYYYYYYYYILLLLGLALVPLAATLRQAHPEVVQALDADDGQLQGRLSRVAVAMIDL
jgi:hypothetical protein